MPDERGILRTFKWTGRKEWKKKLYCRNHVQKLLLNG